MYYLHVKAHQDNKDLFAKLSRKAQLNCICNHDAKARISADGMEAMASCKMFPLEPVGLFVGGQKMMSDTGNHIRFWAHHRLARDYYWDHNILSNEQFDQVDWRSVYDTLHGLPRLFQLWALKHVLGIAGTMKFFCTKITEAQSAQVAKDVPKPASILRNAQRWDGPLHTSNQYKRWIGGCWHKTLTPTYGDSSQITCKAGEEQRALNALSPSISPQFIKTLCHPKMSLVRTSSPWEFYPSSFYHLKVQFLSQTRRLAPPRGGSQD